MPRPFHNPALLYGVESMTLSRLAARTIFLACVLLVGGNAFAAEGIAEKAKLCATCHGEQGIPINKTTPVIWGQNEGYLYLHHGDMSFFRAPFWLIAIYSVIFLMPFYLIQGRGFEPSMAGMILTIQSVLMAITAPFSGYISDKIGSRLPGMVGMGTMSVGLLLLSTINGVSGLWVIILGLTLVGFGTGSFISPNTSALMGAAPGNQQGVASAMQAESRSFGMVLGIGLAGAIFTTHLAANTPQALFTGVDKGFLAGAGVAALGVMTSYFKKR